MIMNKTFEGVEQEEAKAESPLKMVSCEVVKKPPRILLYGVEGIGKSSWAASAQNTGHNPIFIPTEDGVNQIKCSKFPQATDADIVSRYLESLLIEKHDYDMVIIDSADWLEKFIWEKLCKKFRVQALADVPYGQGYANAETIWADFLNMFDQLIEKGVAVVLLAHAGIQKIESPDGSSYDNFAPKLHVNSKGKGIMRTMMEWADCVLFCKYQQFTKSQEEGFNRTRTVVSGVGQRMIYTTKQASFDAKNRYSLPPEILMGDQGYSDFGIFWNEFCNSPVFK